MPADPRPVALVDEGLGNSSYLLDLGDGRALVIDPERDPAPYLAAAERLGLVIAYAAETHLHADFVSGSRELAARGAQVIASAAGGPEFPHRGLRPRRAPPTAGPLPAALPGPAWPFPRRTSAGCARSTGAAPLSTAPSRPR